MPQRRAPPSVERRLFLAVVREMKVLARYASVNSGVERERWIHPRAFAHDGGRWHVRAWCELRERWSDFTLGRFVAAEWPVDGGRPSKEDVEWETWTTVRLRAHRGLTLVQQAAVERDYAMEDGILALRVRRAMEGYLRSRLRVALADGSHPPLLLEEFHGGGDKAPG